MEATLLSTPPERAHELAVAGLRAVQGTPVEDRLARRYRVDDDRLAIAAMGLEFPNPVGVAAGFDKNAVIPRGLAALGFGHVEVGGVFTAADAYEKLRAGACVVQLYTGLVYEGSSIARDINEGLLDLLDRDGFDDVAEALGADL